MVTAISRKIERRRVEAGEKGERAEYDRSRAREPISGAVGTSPILTASAELLTSTKLALLATIAITVGMPDLAWAQDAVAASPETTVEILGVVGDDEDVLLEDGGIVTSISLGALPAGSEVDAYHELDNGELLFSLDTVVDLAGLVIEPADVVRYDGVVYSIEFDADVSGVPAGVNTDALSMYAPTELLLSFDTTVELSSTYFEDEDVVHWDGVTFNPFFTGSAEGVAPGLDVDAAHYRIVTDKLELSFNGSGNLGGIDFDDEDILEFDFTSTSWLLTYDASSIDSDWEATDLTATHIKLVPEPSELVLLVSGLLLLGGLERRRSLSRGAS